MILNPLPPQAYTKDTLLKAYNWLMGQNNSIKEIATTPDILVSLYLKAQRNGEEALEAPSIQNFKAELKNIANMMGDFSTPVVHSAPVVSTPPQQHQTPQQQVVNTQTVASSSSEVLSFSLDAKSLAMIQEVKTTFNLSNDNEAVRMLLAIGYAKAKTII